MVAVVEGLGKIEGCNNAIIKDPSLKDEHFERGFWEGTEKSVTKTQRQGGEERGNPQGLRSNSLI